VLKDRKVHREVRMTVNLVEVYECKMKDKNEWREYFASTVAKTLMKHSGQSVKT
jgi:hypothetical protein